MRAGIFLLAGVSALLVSACAGNVWYEADSVSTPSIASGTVVNVKLVASQSGASPHGSTYHDCGVYVADARGIVRPQAWGSRSTNQGCGDEFNYPDSVEVAQNAVRERGADDVLNLGAGEKLHITVRLNSGEKIVVVSFRDIGLEPGEPVEVGFETPEPDLEPMLATLSRR